MLELAGRCDLGPPLVALVVVSLASLFYYYHLTGFRQRRGGTKNLPPGSLGLPVIGESWSFVRAHRTDRAEEWVQERTSAYGPVFTTSLMGCPTVVITGRPGNRFVFSAADEILAVKQPPSVVRISGKQNLFELTGARYKIVKGAVMSFLKPESLQEYIAPMDALVKSLILSETEGKEHILAVPLMKWITFNLTCTLLFGLHDDQTKVVLFEDFSQAFKGLWSIPLNLPGTAYRRALRARSRITKRVLPILRSKKEDMVKGNASAKDDMISFLLALRDENNELMGEEEVVDNFVALMIASHDTTAILLSLMVWKLARDPNIYQKVLEEHMGIIRERLEETQGKLTWNEVQKMKYIWRVAQELMRVIPPVFGNFRKALKDINYGGYNIPQGWQVFWETSGTQMDKDIFEDPSIFDPSRFENQSKLIPPFAYVPFGAGHRMCIGNEYARVEVLTVIHHLVTNFEWFQLCPDESITRNPMPYPSKGLPIKLKPREVGENLVI